MSDLDLEKELNNILSGKVTRINSQPFIPFEKALDAVHEIFHTFRRIQVFNPEKDSRLLLTFVGDKALVMEGVGYQWEFWNQWRAKPVDFSDHVEVRSFGLCIWEGSFYNRIPGQKSILGYLRPLTNAEWEKVKKCEIPWDKNEWLL